MITGFSEEVDKGVCRVRKMHSKDTYMIPQRYLKDIMLDTDGYYNRLRADYSGSSNLNIMNPTSWDVYRVERIDECVYSEDGTCRIVMYINKAEGHPFGSGPCTTYMDVNMTGDEWLMMIRDAKLSDICGG